jgi:DNA polymerase elongation subunit (family B)
MGYDVIYGDTDSLFLVVKGEEDAKNFLMKANSVLPGVMELDLNGIYKTGLFVPAKSGVTAKKRYALLSQNGSLVIKGFEKVRRDWSVIAKDTQESVLRFVLKDKSPGMAAEAVRKSISRLEKGQAKMEELVIYTKLTRPLSEYEQIGPHVAAARKMEKAGIAVGEGTNIAYVITKGEGSISDRAEPAEAAHDYDPEYYVNNQVIPAALRVLSIFGYDEESIREKKEAEKQAQDNGNGKNVQPSLADFTKAKRRQKG